MSEEFIVSPREKLLNIKTGEQGQNLAIDLHKANGKKLMGVHWYINDVSDKRSIDYLDALSKNQSDFAYFNDRVMMFEPSDLKAKLLRANDIEWKLLYEGSAVTKSEAAEAFSFVYHLFNPANTLAAVARATYEKVFEVLELGPILPASILVENRGGGLSDMQRKAQQDKGGGTAP